MRSTFVIALLLAAPLYADEVVSPPVGPGEVGRYQIAAVRGGTGLAQVKLDSMTGASWAYCRKGAKGNWGWCKMGNKGPLSPGPVGRFRMISAEGGFTTLLLDTVSGRTWGMCDDPTPEKSFSWCAIDD